MEMGVKASTGKVGLVVEGFTLEFGFCVGVYNGVGFVVDGFGYWNSWLLTSPIQLY